MGLPQHLPALHRIPEKGVVKKKTHFLEYLAKPGIAVMLSAGTLCAGAWAGCWCGEAVDEGGAFALDRFGPSTGGVGAAGAFVDGKAVWGEGAAAVVACGEVVLVLLELLVVEGLAV